MQVVTTVPEIVKPGLEDRLAGMLVGALVGDAAGLGSHWIYNLEDLHKQFPEGLQGFDAPAEGHYHFGKEPGAFTHYGDAALTVLKAVAEAGKGDPQAIGQAWAAECMPQNGYQGYFDSASRGTAETYFSWLDAGNSPEAYDWQQGADDDQLATATSIAPVVAAHFQDPNWAGAIGLVTRVRQNNARAVAYNRVHGALLRELLAGRDVHSAFHRVEAQLDGSTEPLDLEIRRKLGEAFSLKHKSVAEATQVLGQSCPLLCSFPSAAHAAIRYPEDFKTCLLEILGAGGDNAGRAAIAGAWLGASLGLAQLPTDWVDRLNAKAEILKAAHSLADKGAAGLETTD
ncbi:MAG: ADP-ribosylglycohydrolase family protein [Opitutales bacterium]